MVPSQKLCDSVEMLPLNQRNLPPAARSFRGMIAGKSTLRDRLRLDRRRDRRTIARTQTDPFQSSLTRELHHQFLERGLQSCSHVLSLAIASSAPSLFFSAPLRWILSLALGI